MKPRTVCIYSGKGGTGKTLISCNIAYRLREHGKVFLIDADIDNSNLAQFTGIEESIKVTDDYHFILPEWEGIKVFSMSLLAGKYKSISMTADNYVRILKDVILFGDWAGADYIVVDLPAGSSDVFRGILEMFSETLVGNIVVIQPNMEDSARRAMNIHKYFGIPVIGVIENMAYFICDNCGKVHYLFGKPIGEKLCREYGYEYLGTVPLKEDVVPGRNIIIRGEGEETIEKAVEKIINAQIVPPSIIQQIKENITRAIKNELEKFIANMIVLVQKEIDFRKYAEEVGWQLEGHPIAVVVLDEDNRPIARICFKIVEGKLKVLRKCDEVDFYVEAPFRTLARMFLGKAKLPDGSIVDYDPLDAWLHGEVRVYGVGVTPRVGKLLQIMFTHKDIVEEIRRRYGKFLEKFI